MFHGPAVQEDGVDHAIDFKSALGVKLFWVYAIVYAGFVAIGLWSVDTFETIVFWGLNLAVVYGFGLILFALLLAVVYDRVCTAKERELNTPGGGGGAAPAQSPAPAAAAPVEQLTGAASEGGSTR